VSNRLLAGKCLLKLHEDIIISTKPRVVKASKERYFVFFVDFKNLRMPNVCWHKIIVDTAPHRPPTHSVHVCSGPPFLFLASNWMNEGKKFKFCSYFIDNVLWLCGVLVAFAQKLRSIKYYKKCAIQDIYSFCIFASYFIIANWSKCEIIHVQYWLKLSGEWVLVRKR
jgi:hypothetical protein